MRLENVEHSIDKIEHAPDYALVSKRENLAMAQSNLPTAPLIP